VVLIMIFKIIKTKRNKRNARYIWNFIFWAKKKKIKVGLWGIV